MTDETKEHYKRQEFILPKEAGKSYSVMLLGSTRSGKTTCMNYILNKYYKDEINVLMSDSLHAEIYKPLMTTMVPCPTFVPEIIKTCYQINKGTNCKYPFNII
jgi:septin family protein